MNVLSLFDGMSCGRIALDRANIEVGTYYASEIDKWATIVSETNYPDIIRMGDVTKWKDWDIDWGGIDLVLAGFPCFVAGTLVRTKDGLKPIESIELGDFVLTHNNRYREVVELMCKDSDHINNVKIQGSHLLQATDEHPFYTRSMKRYGKESKRQFSDPEWIECKNLERGKHFVGIPINRDRNESDFDNRPEFWRFIGRWVADGYSSTSNKIKAGSDGYEKFTYRVILTCGLHEESNVDNLMGAVFGDSFSKSIERTAIKYIVTNKDLWNFVQKFGRGAHNKGIPEIVVGLKKELLIEFIEGYLDGDGSMVRSDNYKSCKNSYSMTTVSERLAYGVSAIISKVYGTLPNITKTIRSKKTVIEGREVSQRDTYMLRFHKEKPSQSHYFIEGDFIWSPFKGRERVAQSVEVFNIAVDGDNSYTVNNLIVHNCQAWSMAGKRLGDRDPRGALFWTMLDIISKVMEHNPNVKFLLENVKMKREFEEYITHHTEQALGKVHKNLINSSLVSAQNRQRYYWTNFPVSQPEDRGITWGDVREHGVNAGKFYYTEKAIQWLARHSQRKNKTLSVHKDDEKMQMLEASHHKKYSSQRFFGICDVPSDKEAVGSMRGRRICPETLKRVDDRKDIKPVQHIEFRYDGKSNCLSTVAKDNVVVPFTLPNRIPVDSFFFRYITPLECERLQTVPEKYTDAVSDTQRYKMLGNGWTVDVIAHIFKELIDKKQG